MASGTGRYGVRPWCRWRHWVAAGSLVASLCACVPAVPGVPGGPGGPGGSPQVLDRDIAPECGSAATARKAQLQGTAELPRCDNGTWLFMLPADGSPDRLRRSEVWLATEQRSEYRVGDRARLAATFVGSLGAAAHDAADWHVVWQLHGSTNGIWKGPAMTLVVRRGQWALAGGHGHADHSPGAQDHYWTRDLAPYADGVPVRIVIDAQLQHDASGTISAWVDDVPVVQAYRPRSAAGLEPGTIYPGQDVVVSRVGLYRGTLDSGTPPTYAQQVRVTVTEVG